MSYKLSDIQNCMPPKFIEMLQIFEYILRKDCLNGIRREFTTEDELTDVCDRLVSICSRANNFMVRAISM
jgi:hypothetical protein